MGFVTFILLTLNTIGFIIIDCLISSVSPIFGLAGLFGIIAYFIGYALSVELTLAPRDFWINSEFGIFIRKLGVANFAALMVWAISVWLMGGLK